ncbi:phage/plasmid primase, P4 family, partial [Bradyrhizobium sp.]|uniref:phage/plasmid primase, P4 family n=1 Tax=Bradyrhizobium sp. TaxID=376 RepID=UPI0025C2C02B
AAIGAPQGVNGLFVLDFDPRIDPETGEVFTLERLKADLEAQMGEPLPISAASITPSGGVHVFFAQPDDGGAEIRNRGNLPEHVDVRGKGGYVVLPPSRLPGYESEIYRWHRPIETAPPVQAPAKLIEILRAPKARPAARPRDDGDRVTAADEAVRKYALAAIDAELRLLADTPPGGRNNQINASAFALGQLVGAGAVSKAMVRAALEDVVSAWPDLAKSQGTIESGLNAGIASPRDLSDVAQKAGKPARPRGRSAAALPARERSPATPSPAAASSDPLDADSPAPPSSFSSADPPAPSFTDDGKPGSREPVDMSPEACAARAEEHQRLARQLCLALLPLTDLGNRDRALKMFGDRFLFCIDQGWAEWTGTHWRWHRQKEPPASMMLAIVEMVLAIEEQARLLAKTGTSDWGDTKLQGPRLDRVVKSTTNTITRLSDLVRKHATASQANARINSVADMLRPALTVASDRFDRDPLLFNVQNGTLSFEQAGPECSDWLVELRPHRREDYITKISPVVYDAKATCPTYDAFLERVQPNEDVRDFLHRWGGLSLTALRVQKMVQHYGTGRNGKGTMVEAHAYVAGDYAGTINIESLLSTGQQRSGNGPSPDLAKLPGLRMLRVTEPEEDSVLAIALVKRMTGNDPIDARHNYGAFFTFKPDFKLSYQSNYELKIPGGGDAGIWGRMRMVSWDVVIPDAEQDTELPQKLEAEGSGILNRLIEGALDFLTSGLKEPSEILARTEEYRDRSDPVGVFLRECVDLTENDKDTVGARYLWNIYCAWARANGHVDRNGRPLSEKKLGDKLRTHRLRQVKNSSMFWLRTRIRAGVDVSTFIDPLTGEPYPPPKAEDAGGLCG